MNVGILTMHRVFNYGSFLQAYGLKRIIEKLGHECSFLDIEKGVNLRSYETAKIPKNKKTISWFLKRIEDERMKVISSYLYKRKYRNRFKDFLKMLNLSEELVTDKKFDIVVIGSDEVFNFAQPSRWGYTRQLFGEGIDAKKIISYAASFGWTTIDDVIRNGLTEELRDALKNVSSLSVRDENSYEIIRYLTSKPPVLSVDPTLIYDFSEEIANRNLNKDFLILYSYSGRTDSDVEIKEIRKFAKKVRKKVISLGFYHSWCDKNVIASPFNFLNYFINADYIITDTFHGTVLSIKFNKKFCTLIRDSNSEKLSFLLKQFNLRTREAVRVREIPIILEKPIEYTEVNSILKREKERSLQYLNDSLTL